MYVGSSVALTTVDEARAGSSAVTCVFVQATSPYLSGVPSVGSTYAQYYAPQLMPMLGHDPAAAAASPLGVMQQPVLQQKLPRTDRLEVGIAFLL